MLIKRKSTRISKDKANDYQKKLIHAISERDRIRDEQDKQYHLAHKADTRLNQTGLQPDEEKNLYQVYNNHAAQYHNLKQKVHDLKEQITKISDLLDKGGYNVNLTSGIITPKTNEETKHSIKRKNSSKGTSLPREIATEYQQRLIQTITERDRVRGEEHEEYNLAANIQKKVNEAEFQSPEQKRLQQVYERHATQYGKLKQRVHELEEHMNKIAETLDTGGYEVNVKTGSIVPKNHPASTR